MVRDHGGESIDDLLPAFDERGAFAAAVGDWEAPAAEALLQRRELRETVRRCIDRLPDSHWSLPMLRDIEELDTDATADLLGLIVSAVKSRLHRARQALRHRLVAALGADAAQLLAVG